MEDGGFAPNMMAGEGLPNMVGNVFPPITPTLLPSDVLPNLTPTLLPRDVLPTITPVVVPTTIVREVLTEGNYAYWRTCIRRYLKGQGLWDVCKKSCFIPHKAQDPERYSVWKRKNDMALHAIQISCSREMLSQIRDETRASEAWDFLKRIANPTLDLDREIIGFEELSPDASAPAGKAPSLFLMLKIVMSLYIIDLDNTYTSRPRVYIRRFIACVPGFQ